MPSHAASFLDIESASPSTLRDLFSLAQSLKKQNRAPSYAGSSLALMFFEVSTRTRMSFESAAHRMGMGVLLFDGGQSSSLEKGETVEDTILNVAAMRPKAMVIRCGNELDLKDIVTKISVPVVNAGWGVKGHPTQALLDAFTIAENLKEISGRKVLFVGDIKHSRVVSSHFELAKKLNYEIGLCGPENFLVERPSVRNFSSLADGLEWADAVMALRVQFERHDSAAVLSKEDYRAKFGLNPQSLKNLKPSALIMHPGPINHGIELETEILKDPRCKVLEQVTHGVWMREALLRYLLGEKP